MGEEIFLNENDSELRGTTFIKRTHEVLKDLGSVVGSDLGSFQITLVKEDGSIVMRNSESNRLTKD